MSFWDIWDSSTGDTSIEDDIRAGIKAIYEQKPEPYRCPHTLPMHPRLADKFHGVTCPMCGVILVRPQRGAMQ